MRSIREQKRNSILAMVTISGEVVFEVIIPMLMANLIDYGIDAGNMNYIVKMGLVLLLSAAGQLLCGIASGKFAAEASSGFARNLRHDMFYKVQNFSFSNIDKFSTASIVTRLTTDVTNLQNTYQMIIRMAVRSPLMMIFSLVAAFAIDAQLSLIFLAIIPILALGLYFIMTRTHPIFERVFRTYDWLNGIVQENLHGIRVVKSFVREDHEKKKFNSVSERIYKDFKKAEQRLAWNAPLMQLCMYAAVILISWFGARDHRRLRRRRGARPFDRRAAEPDLLRDADPHEPDGPLDDLRHDHDVPHLRRARHRAARRDTRHLHAGQRRDRSAGRQHRV